MALDGPSVLSPVYRCILARSYFELGDFSNAARHYRILLRSDVQLLVDLGLKGGLYQLAARSARLAGQSREAQQIVNEWRAECPADAEAILEQAELQACESRYAEAAEAFKEAVRLRPELELGLGARIALALGGISGNAQAQAELCRQLSKEYPQVCELISRICAAYWPPFATLCQEARDSWKKAIVTYYWFALEADAITKFAMAVEIELRSGVFVPFKHAVSESPEFQNAARAGLGTQDAGIFCSYLLSRGRLALGQMGTVLQLAWQSDQEILAAFRTWLNRSRPGVIGMAERVIALSKARNRAAHEGLASKEVEEIHQASREIISRLHQAASPQP